jgi:uncharacterized protein YbjQ (UPF0145 family)
MQLSRTDSLPGARDHYAIGRIKACSGWRGVNASAAEIDRRAAVEALIREAQDCDADGIVVGLEFEVEGLTSSDIDGAPLQRVGVTGLAVRFAEAA